ncbi:hypothetical protein [Rhodopirellula sallentina]|uniref:hypothetical protein n=1 Tax=Rhodopirellula sallentina TaxID=1263869 RepID=UPI001181A3B8|nr:hypothetical protein [Rhodopirellula sallentina]
MNADPAPRAIREGERTPLRVRIVVAPIAPEHSCVNRCRNEIIAVWASRFTEAAFYGERRRKGAGRERVSGLGKSMDPILNAVTLIVDDLTQGYTTATLLRESPPPK